MAATNPYAPEKPPAVGLARPGVARAVYTALVDLGADPDQLASELGLEAGLFDRGARVPYASLGRLIAHGADRTGCPHLGILVGRRSTLASLGPLGLLMRHSDTVGDALRALEAHAGTQNWGAVVGLAIGSDVAVLSYCPYGPDAEGAPLQSERALATTTAIIRILAGSGSALLEVLLPRSMPRDPAPYRDVFRAPVRFDQEVAALVFPARLLAQRIEGADPAVRRRAEDRIRTLEAGQTSNLTDDLRQYLRAQVTRQRCKAEQVARLRLVSLRTLSRHLKSEGTTFKRLANEAQCQVAKRLLADTRMTMAEVSAILDFSEPAAFSHAFRRWSGMTPSAWRREHQPETSLGQLQA
ncbi:AraC family transcriptional regulator [Methylobacterium sp. P1-11]|uniref:AraC family transcriptional regulator n=1 Tax=Methylobacterium sp. P1-11 TaxID=2024616 RepID=UPI0011EDEB22|nr:AraC family transcriptional regulator [Methylobacterium sp. P1-11]KAA0114901.1 AraC family transcriptional regulator [Methylobacterium sp. P1-11]